MQPRSSFRNGLKRRSKRDDQQYVQDDEPESCNDNLGDACEPPVNLTSNVVQVASAELRLSYEHEPSFSTYNKKYLRENDMCGETSECLFNNKAFQVVISGQISLLQVGTQNLYSLQSFSFENLLSAGYIQLFGDVYLLTKLGLLALSIGHISTSRLTELNLYPLIPGSVSIEVLFNAGFVHKNCFLTAMGLSAVHMKYIENKHFTDFGCRPINPSQTSMSHLIIAGYITSGKYPLITPVGFAAMHTGHLRLNTLQGLGAFKYQSMFHNDRDSIPHTEHMEFLNHLVTSKYVYQENYLITYVGYLAVTHNAIKVEHLRHLKIWPCSKGVTINLLISAQYITSCGHLTQLGYSLLHAQYISIHLLTALGVHLSNQRHVFCQALNNDPSSQSEGVQEEVRYSSSAN